MEYRVRVRVDLELHYFSIFTDNNENGHLSCANFTVDNILLKERTQTKVPIIRFLLWASQISILGQFLRKTRTSVQNSPTYSVWPKVIHIST